MSEKLFLRGGPSQPLRPIGGELYAFVFENERAGVDRNLFWNMRVDFEPVALDGDEGNCSFLIDWLTWPIRAWQELDRMALTSVQIPSMIEPSLYILSEHFPATLAELKLGPRAGSVIAATVKAAAQIETEQGRCTVPISFNCPLRFTGVIVVTANLNPMPTTPSHAASAVRQFMQTDGLKEPRSENWRYVLEPDDKEAQTELVSDPFP